MEFQIVISFISELLASQFEELIVISSPRNVEDWKQINSGIEAQVLVHGLYALKVPSLGGFTDVMKDLALKTEDIKILTVSNYNEVQMKVSLWTQDSYSEGMVKIKLHSLLKAIPGVKIKFDYTLPTVGKDPKNDLPNFVALDVSVPYLLDVIKSINSIHADGVTLDQIYDFWA